MQLVFSNDRAENQLNVTSYNRFSKEGKEVVVLQFIHKEDVPAFHFENMDVPSEFELIWVKIRPKKHPHGV